MIDKEGRPHLNFYRQENTDWFVETFEDKLTKQYYKAYRWNTRNNNDEEDLDTLMQLLLGADEFVPIEAHYNWKEALKKAGEKYRAKKISEAMPEALEQYELHVSMNIAFPEKENIFSLRPARDAILKEILKGRQLNGELEDLNF